MSISCSGFNYENENPSWTESDLVGIKIRKFVIDNMLASYDVLPADVN